MTIERLLLIGGEHVAAASGRRTEDRSPYTGEVVATLSAAGPEDATRAVDAAAGRLRRMGSHGADRRGAGCSSTLPTSSRHEGKRRPSS